jgi:hypothetical protein
LPTTSTRISVPGASFAIRVARVTPLYSWKSPSEPRYNHGAGMPSVEATNDAICRCSLNGSAPDRRDGGTWSVRGSTSRNCLAIRSIVTHQPTAAHAAPPDSKGGQGRPPTASLRSGRSSHYVPRLRWRTHGTLVEHFICGFFEFPIRRLQSARETAIGDGSRGRASSDRLARPVSLGSSDNSHVPTRTCSNHCQRTHSIASQAAVDV